MYFRTDKDSKLVKNPSGCCVNWSVHDEYGDCHHKTEREEDYALEMGSLDGVPVSLPTDDDEENWALLLALRSSIERLREKGRLPAVVHFPDGHYVIEKIGPSKWVMGKVVEAVRQEARNG